MSKEDQHTLEHIYLYDALKALMEDFHSAVDSKLDK